MTVASLAGPPTPDWLFDGSDMLHRFQPMSQLLRTRPTRLDPAAGRLELEFTSTPDHLNFMGVVHGGLQAAMLDEAASLAGICLLGWERFKGTVDTRATFLRPLGAGLVKARARLLHQTGRLAFAEAELLGPDGAACATGYSILALGGAPKPAA